MHASTCTHTRTNTHTHMQTHTHIIVTHNTHNSLFSYLFFLLLLFYAFCEAHWVALLYEMCYINTQHTFTFTFTYTHTHTHTHTHTRTHAGFEWHCGAPETSCSTRGQAECGGAVSGVGRRATVSFFSSPTIEMCFFGTLDV